MSKARVLYHPERIYNDGESCSHLFYKIIEKSDKKIIIERDRAPIFRIFEKKEDVTPGFELLSYNLYAKSQESERIIIELDLAQNE